MVKPHRKRIVKWGRGRLGKSPPVTSQAVFKIGSITKIFAALLSGGGTGAADVARYSTANSLGQPQRNKISFAFTAAARARQCANATRFPDSQQLLRFGRPSQQARVGSAAPTMIL